MLPINEIICGAMPEATKVFPDGYFNCSISSPPYWALRDYGVDGQLGLEPIFEEYIDKLCTIYDEVKRVLRVDGTCWVNLGDTYNSGGNYRVDGAESDKDNPFLQKGGNSPDCGRVKVDTKLQGLPTKSLYLIPQRFAIEMVNRGWTLRNVIIWHKPNPMPSSAKDRFTVDFEYVYFFVKSRKYWFEPQYEPQYEPHTRDWAGCGGNLAGKGTHKLNDGFKDIGDRTELSPNPLGRNKRTVWTIPTQPFPEAHFATFPEKLVEPMIKAGCPEFVCTKCGKAREKMYDKPKPPKEVFTDTSKPTDGYIGGYNKDGEWKGCGQKLQNWLNEHPKTFKGYTDCGCNAEYRPGIMIDIFAGSGTSLQVAARLRRDWIGIELKPEYIEMAEKRATQGETGISVKEQRQGQMPLFKENPK